MDDRELGAPEPPRRSAGDAVHMALRAALSAIPGAGGPAAELLSFVVAPPLQKRTTEWMESVAAELRRQGLVLEELAGDDRLSALVWQGLHIAARFHHREKLEALRNAVVNSAAGAGPDDDELPALFLRYVDELTPSHLRLLAFFFQNEEEAQVGSYEELFQLTAGVAPGVRSQFRLSCEDLASRSLVRMSREISDFPGMFEHGRLLLEEDTEGKRLEVTLLGRAFLRFISETPPAAPKQEAP